MTSSSSSSSRAPPALLLVLVALLGAARADDPTPEAPAAAPGAATAAPAAPAAVPEPPSAPPAAPAVGTQIELHTFEAQRDVAPPRSRAAPGPGRRLALFPVQNLTGAAAPMRELTAALRETLGRRGVTLVPDEEVRAVLAEHRVRHLGGLDGPTAEALRTVAGVDAVIIPSLASWSPAPPFRVALSTRLVSTEREPVVEWTDQFARTGNDAPGPLGLRIVPGVEGLRDLAFAHATASLLAVLEHPRRVAPCPEERARKPRRFFRSELARDDGRRTIAVLPFMDASGRRDAGEVVALRFLAELAAADSVRLVEPGVARAQMISHRLGASGPLALDDARIILELVDADLILSGTVRTFEEAAGGSGAPRVEFSAWVLDRSTQELVWSSTSSAAGDDGVFFFGLGRTSTADGLACGLTKGVVRTLLHGRPPLPPGAAGAARRPGERTRSAQR